MSDTDACKNTDREIWRGPDEGGGDFYADSLHITKEGALGINCGGTVYVKPIREWHRLAGGPISGLKPTTAVEQEREACARIAEMPSTGQGITIAEAIRARGSPPEKETPHG